MTDLPLFAAISRGREQADACTEKARQTLSDWPEQAYYAFGRYLAQMTTGDLFSSESAVDACHSAGLERPHDDRAWGSIFSKCARLGIISKTNQTYQRTKGHGSPAFLWRIN